MERNQCSSVRQAAEKKQFSYRRDPRRRKSRLVLPEVAVVTANDFASEGELVALMGPSGSGKSTLLNVLARRPSPRKSVVHGDTLINCSSIAAATFRQISGYVEQEDSLIGSLTARETLDFAARLSLPWWAYRNPTKPFSQLRWRKQGP